MSGSAKRQSDRALGTSTASPTRGHPRGARRPSAALAGSSGAAVLARACRLGQPPGRSAACFSRDSHGTAAGASAAAASAFSPASPCAGGTFAARFEPSAHGSFFGLCGFLRGRKPPFWAVNHPARPYTSAIQNKIYYVEHDGRSAGPGGPGPELEFAVGLVDAGEGGHGALVLDTDLESSR